jgi:UDP-3-O-[3-hydroxymyristoyl] glucosamine N-acyltransferase LpxD
VLLEAKLIGPDLFLEHLGSLESADSGDLSFLDENTRPARVWASRAGALLAPDPLREPLEGRTLLLHPSLREALARLLEGPSAPILPPPAWLTPDDAAERFGERARGAWIHPAAFVAPTVRLSPGVVIHAGCTVGEGCLLEPGAVLHPGSVLDRNCQIGAHAVLGSAGFGLVPAPGGFRLLPHHAGVRLGEGVHVGAQGNVAAGLVDPTFLDGFCHLDAQVQVGHNCRIGARTRIAAQTGLSGSVTLGEDCVVGGQAGFADHVRLGDGCVVAARSGVTRSWPEGTRLGGFPAQPIGSWRRETVRGRLSDPPGP